MTYNLISNIEFLLYNRNLTHDDLGKLIGNTGGAAISNWLNRKAKPPLVKVIAICKEFNLDLDTLVFGDTKDVERVLSGHSLEETVVKTWGKNTVTLDDSIFNDPKGMVVFLEFIAKYHDQLKEKEDIYKRFTDFIGKEYLYEKELRKLRGEVDEDAILGQ